ncbi:pentapeptide repeat-containing protein [Streptomyces microflavus]|uniref:pentapeptide repeat-containing protein n=1 Tax=Streptomyces microflavus TaxID=1919 RepID=UPI0033A37770
MLLDQEDAGRVLLAVAGGQGLEEDGRVGAVRGLPGRLPQPGRDQHRDLGGDGCLAQRLQRRTGDGPGQRVDEERGGERGDLGVDLLTGVDDHRPVAPVAERLLGRYVGGGPDEQPAWVVQRLGRQFVVEGAGLRTVGDLDRATGTVQRLRTLGALVGRPYGVCAPLGHRRCHQLTGAGTRGGGLLGRRGAVLSLLPVRGVGVRAPSGGGALTLRRGGELTAPAGTAEALVLRVGLTGLTGLTGLAGLSGLRVLLLGEVLGERHALAQRPHAEGPPLGRVRVAAGHRLLGGQRLVRRGDGRGAGGVGGLPVAAPGTVVRRGPCARRLSVRALRYGAPGLLVRHLAGAGVRYAVPVARGRDGPVGVRGVRGVRGHGVGLRSGAPVVAFVAGRGYGNGPGRLYGHGCGAGRLKGCVGGPVRVGGGQGERGTRTGVGGRALLGRGQRSAGPTPTGLLGRAEGERLLLGPTLAVRAALAVLTLLRPRAAVAGREGGERRAVLPLTPRSPPGGRHRLLRVRRDTLRRHGLPALGTAAGALGALGRGDDGPFGRCGGSGRSQREGLPLRLLLGLLLDGTLPDTRRAGPARTDLRRTDLGRTDLGRTRLRRTGLRRTHLRRTDLRRTDLRRTDLRRPDLGRPDLRRPVPARPCPRPGLRRAGTSAPAAGALALLGRDQLGSRLLLGGRGPAARPAPPGRLGGGTVALAHRIGRGRPFGLGRTAGAVQERVGRGPARPAPPATGDARRADTLGGGGRGRLHRGLRRRDGARTGADRDVEDVRAAAHPGHLVGLEHSAVRLDDAAHDRLVHRVSPGERPAHLDPDHITALGGGHDDRRVDVSAPGDGPGLAGRVDPGHIRDQVGEGGGELTRVDLGLDRRGVHGELGASGPDQLDRPVDTARDDPVDQRGSLVQPLHARVEALVPQHVVDEGGHPGVPGGEVVQDLVGLGPQLPGRVGGEHGQLTAQLLQGPAQRTAEDGGELGVLGAQGGDALGLLRQLGGVPLGAVGQLGLVPLGPFRDLGGVGLLQRRQLGGVRFLERGDLVGVARGQLGDDGRVLGGELFVRPAVGEGHHGADELVPVAYRRGRQVHRDLGAALGPEHLAAYAVLAPGLEGVGER